MAHALQPLVDVIRARAQRTLPMHPYALAVALGLELTPRLGALCAMQGARVVFDPRWLRQDRERLVARACAVFALHHADLLRTSSQADIAWLSHALCGVEIYAADACDEEMKV